MSQPPAATMTIATTLANKKVNLFWVISILVPALLITNFIVLKSLAAIDEFQEMKANNLQLTARVKNLESKTLPEASKTNEIVAPTVIKPMPFPLPSEITASVARNKPKPMDTDSIPASDKKDVPPDGTFVLAKDGHTLSPPMNVTLVTP